MGPYSHIVIANELENFIKPDNVQEYYWGAVAPDVRYVVRGMQKKQTHLSSEIILDYIHKYPQQTDFLMGYLVHCLSDHLSLRRIIQGRFPFTLVKNRITKNNCSVILEFLNIELLKPVNHSISAENNSFLSELGINKEQAIKFIDEINNYINQPSYSSSITLYDNLGLAGYFRIEKYKTAVQLWQNLWFIKYLILSSLQLKKVNREIAALVKLQISNLQMDTQKSTQPNKTAI